MKKKMKKNSDTDEKLRCGLVCALLALALLLPPSLWARQSGDAGNDEREGRNFTTTKYFDILHYIFRELESAYVDTTDVEEVFYSAIDGMLSAYDPYTEFYSEDDVSDLQFITTGEYAGIGSVISQQDKRIIVSEPYEGMPAQLAGLQFGDELVEIDGEKMAGKSVSEASERLRGEPNTEVKLLIRREGEKKLLKKTVVRQRIVVDQVKYYGMVAPTTGYIYLSSFTDKAYNEVLHAFKELKAQGAEKMILDLRGNGGGLLSEAVSICNMFVPKGEPIVTTKGRDRLDDRIYKTMREPVDTAMPLAVLVNSGTASSSEIVSGALQDLDRAVIIGTRTFGKGLVQSTRELPYNALLKVTTAKYYIPSGRCIQAIDYSNRNADGSVGRIPDSLSTDFLTSHGRTVRDGGGILPDVEVKTEDYSSLAYQLSVNRYFFDYANLYFRRHASIPPVSEFALSDEDYEDFCRYVTERGISYDMRSQLLMKELKRVLKVEGYYDSVKEAFSALEKQLSKDLAFDLQLLRKEIEPLLSAEIVLRYYYQRGEIEQGLKDDPTLRRAIEILDDPARCRALLSPSETKNDPA